VYHIHLYFNQKKICYLSIVHLISHQVCLHLYIKSTIWSSTTMTGIGEDAKYVNFAMHLEAVIEQGWRWAWIETVIE
jgi:hypothetical protein